LTAVAEPAAVPVLEASGIRVRFGGLMALDDVNLRVGAASLTGLVGPNGAGKSTLFGVCSGLIKPNGGRVVLRGREVTEASPQARARLGLARTFQQPELFMGLTVRQHLTLAYRASRARRRLLTDMFTAASLRRPGPEETERVDGLLELLSLTDKAHRVVDVLPLGATRLVEVGRALAANPSLVLLDEPLSGLDANESAHLAHALLRVVDEEKISLLLVEHDVATVLRLCGHIYVLDFGTVIAEGDAATIRRDPAVRAAYLGDDPYGDDGT
jgi:ABC-type branched-subunit amino acid transport system ATPase component